MGKLVSQTRLKWNGDLFHLFLFPYQFSQIIPNLVHSVDILDGSWGTVGSVISSSYILGGAHKVTKVVVEAIDKNMKSITFKAIEGYPLNFYSEFKIICEIETDGEDHVLTYALEYKKRSGEMPEPTVFMDFLVHDFSKNVDRA